MRIHNIGIDTTTRKLKNNWVNTLYVCLYASSWGFAGKTIIGQKKLGQSIKVLATFKLVLHATISLCFLYTLCRATPAAAVPPMSSTLEWQFATPSHAGVGKQRNHICRLSAVRRPPSRRIGGMYILAQSKRPSTIRPVRPSVNAALAAAFGLLESWHCLLTRLSLASMLFVFVPASWELSSGISSCSSCQ